MTSTIGPGRAVHQDRRELDLASRGDLRRRIDADAAERQPNVAIVGEIERHDGGQLVHRLVAVFELPLLEQFRHDHFHAGDSAVRRRHRI